MPTFAELGIVPDGGQKVRAYTTTGLPYEFPEDENGWRYEGAEGVVDHEVPLDGFKGQVFRVVYHGDGTSPDSFGIYLTSEIGPAEQA